MAINVGELNYVIKIIDKNSKNALKAVGKSIGGVEKNLLKAQKGIKGFENSLNGFKGKFAGVNKVLKTSAIAIGAVGVAATGAAVVLGTKFVKDAAIAEGTLNKFNTVFGEGKDEMNAFITELRKTMPLARQDIQRLAADTQDLLVPLGLSREKAQEMSQGFLDVSNKIAAFNDVNPTEVLEAIKSGLTGSSEPLKRFGVNANITALETKALELGLLKTGETFAKLNPEVANQIKAQTLLAQITANSSDAIEGFAANNDSLIRRTQDLQASFKEFSAEVGAVFLPIVDNLVKQLLPKFQEVTANITSFLNENKDAIAGVVTNMANLVVEFLKFGAALAGGIIDNLIKLRDFLNEHQGIAIAVGGAIAGALVPSLISLAISLGSVAIAAGAAIIPLLPFIAVGAAIGVAIFALKKAFELLSPIIKEKFGDQFVAVKEAVLGAWDAIKNAFQLGVNFVKRNSDKIVIAIGLMFPPIGLLILAFKGFQNNSDKIFGAVKAIFVAVFKEGVKRFTQLLNIIKFVFNSIEAVINGTINFFTNTVPTFLEKAQEFGSAMVDGIKELPGKFLQLGKDTISGFTQGIKDSFTGALSTMTEFGSKIIGSVKGILGISSPSKVFTELGGQTAEGFLLGISEQNEEAVAVMGTFVEGMTKEASKVKQELDFSGAFQGLEQVVDDAFTSASDSIKEFADNNKQEQERIQSDIKSTISEMDDLKTAFKEASDAAKQSFDQDASQIVLQATQEKAKLEAEIAKIKSDALATQSQDGDPTANLQAQKRATEELAALQLQLAEAEKILTTNKQEGLVSTEQLAEAERVAALDPLAALQERFLAEQEERQLAFDAELLLLEQRKEALTVSLLERQKEFDNFYAQLQAQDQAFSTSFLTQLQTRETATIASINKLITFYNKLALAKRSAGRHDGGFKKGGFTAAGFAQGGYTAKGNENAVAGVVHRGEWVMPKWMVQGMPSLTGQLEGIRTGGAGQITNDSSKVVNVNVTNQGAEQTEFWRNAQYLKFMGGYI